MCHFNWGMAIAAGSVFFGLSVLLQLLEIIIKKIYKYLKGGDK